MGNIEYNIWLYEDSLARNAQNHTGTAHLFTLRVSLVWMAESGVEKNLTLSQIFKACVMLGESRWLSSVCQT